MLKKNVKNIAKIGANLFALEHLVSITGKNILLPFYHAVSDNCPLHLKKLYQPRAIEQFKNDLDFLLKHYRSISLLELIDISEASLRFDVAELTGYGYHNGPVYSLYHPKFGSALAQGGRYNGLAHADKDTNRPATGFDMDLRMFLSEIQPLVEELIFAPFGGEDNRVDLMNLVAKLRTKGKNVVCALSPTEEASEFCTHYFSYKSGEWTIAESV